MTTQPVELAPHTKPIARAATPLHRWSLAELRAATSAIPHRLRWQVLPTAVQFVLASLLAAGVVLGSAVALIALFDAWYGPLLDPAMRALGL